jgi:hypothetical protein
VLWSVTTQSRIHRWLTSNPDPDVVAIDLENTTSGRLLLSLLGIVGRPRERQCRSSRVRRAAESMRVAFLVAPVRTAATIAGGALLVETALTLATAGEVAPLPKLLLALAVGIGLQSTSSWSDLRGGLPGRALRGLLTPPEPTSQDDASEERRPPGEDAHE